MSFFKEQHKATYLFLPHIPRKGLPGAPGHRQKGGISFFCKGKCSYVEKKVSRAEFRFTKELNLNVRYCSACDCYLEGGTTRCKCCGCKKRTRRISTKYRNRFKMGTPKLNCGAKIS